MAVHSCTPSSLSTFYQNIAIPPCQRIIALLKRIACMNLHKRFELPIFTQCLGFLRHETTLARRYITLLHQIDRAKRKDQFEVIPTEIPGMFMLQIAKATIGFFKVGLQRAEIEGFVHTLAEFLGFGQFVIRGIPGVVTNYEIPKNASDEERPSEFLWNGLLKTYLPGVAPRMGGILEYCLPVPQELDLSPFDIVNLTIVCWVALLRDIKLDGIGMEKGHPVLFDIEDAFGVLETKSAPEKTSSRIDYSFLDLPNARVPITEGEVHKLKQKMDFWNFEALELFLTQQKIALIDLANEKAQLKANGVDAEKCSFKIQGSKPDPHHAYPHRSSDRPYSLLTPQQIDSVLAATRQLHLILTRWEGPMSAEALVFALDPKHALIVQSLRTKNASEAITHNAHRTAGTVPPCLLAKRELVTPDCLVLLTSTLR